MPGRGLGGLLAGGDGTFNETLAGILESGLNTPIGYIPAGSTNDFASSLKLSSDILEATQDIILGTPVAYDAGKFGERYFSYVASFGAFTRTSYATPRASKTPWATRPTCWRAFRSCPRSARAYQDDH